MIFFTYSAAFFSAATAAVCIILIFHPAYRNRLVRLCGLCIIALAGSLRVLTIVLEGDTVSKIGWLLWLGAFLFFMSHVCSFIKRLRVRNTEKWYADTQIFSVKERR